MSELELADQTVFIPRSVGPYKVESELGAGAMGTVFRAVHTGLERAVALKVLRPDMLQDPDSVRRFLREARSVARLEHPHIVSVYDAGEVDGIYYIAMKLLEGETLQALLARTGPLPAERVVRLGSQLASALDYAHVREVVHLDVKPANVIVAPRDVATLTDFSIAQALNPGATRSATISGTPLYMSPEQIQGKDVDSRSDIYSLGLLLYEMCVGNPPFQGPFVTVMYAHLHTPIPEIREQAPGIPDSLAAVIEHALAKDRTQRYQTAGELLRALDRCVDNSTVNVAHTMLLGQEEAVKDDAFPAETLIQTTAPAAAQTHVAVPAKTVILTEAAAAPRSWRKPGILAGAVVAIAAIGGGAFFALRPSAATTGSLSIAALPAGASVSLDGAPLGKAPFTLSKIHDGQHQLEVTAPTYFPARRAVTVAGGHTSSVRISLSSWPITRLISANGILSTSVSQDPQTGNFLVAGRLKQLSAIQARRTTIYSIVQFTLAPSAAAARRSVRVVPQYMLYDPDGILIPTFNPHLPALTLDAKQTTRAFKAGFKLSSNRGLLPSGTYQLRLVANGGPLAAMSFAITR